MVQEVIASNKAAKRFNPFLCRKHIRLCLEQPAITLHCGGSPLIVSNDVRRLLPWTYLSEPINSRIIVMRRDILQSF
jgi:hypothetical protein